MATAGASEQHLPRAGYLETFSHRFSGFNTLGASHVDSLSSLDLLKLFSRQLIQLISQCKHCGIFIRVSALIPTARSRPQQRQKQMFKGLVNS